jgi:glycosyltransferase involved in cell wall biosynthesis
VLINNARGGADRIVFEAAATGLVVLTSNRAHADLLDEDAFFDDEQSLAQRLAEAAALSPGERAVRGRELRERVLQHHSVESWSEGLLEAARS